MASIIPQVHIDPTLHEQLCKELDVQPCEIRYEFMAENGEDYSGKTVAGTYGWGGVITIYLHRRRIGRIVPENKKKKIQRCIAETILHEYRHHYQHMKRTMRFRFPDEDYWTHPTEVDARAFAKAKVNRYWKMVSISK
jgi:hypothetical protein